MCVREESFMKSKRLVWILFMPLILFFSLMLYLEVDMYSVLPHEKGGMSFWMEFKYVWYRSIWFYALLFFSSFLLYLQLGSHKKNAN